MKAPFENDFWDHPTDGVWVRKDTDLAIARVFNDAGDEAHVVLSRRDDPVRVIGEAHDTLIDAMLFLRSIENNYKTS